MSFVMNQVPSSNQFERKYSEYLNDESGIVDDGRAERIFFPYTLKQLQEVVKNAFTKNIPITISGGGTGISGGRVPRGGWIIATDKLKSLNGDFQLGKTWYWKDPTTKEEFQVHLQEITEKTAELTIPISMTLKSIQKLVKEIDWFYPPDPTERTCYIGGNVATNASGARSFKYGSTRNWIKRLWVVLPNGELIDLDRKNDHHQLTANHIIINGRKQYSIPRPIFNTPRTRKHVAGPVINDESHPIDLFIGTEGLFGIIAQVTIKLIKPPEHLVSIFVYFDNIDPCLKLVEICQQLRENNSNIVPLSVEYLGPRAISIIKQNDPSINENAHSVIILELNADREDELYSQLEFWLEEFDTLKALDTSVAQTYSEIEHHKYLRHKVPETVNSFVRSFGQSKLGTDYSVPLSKTAELFSLSFNLGEKFEDFQRKSADYKNQYGYAIWAHGGDAHIHLNFLPRNNDEKLYAKELMLDMMKQVVSWGGSIAAEHGLGKKEFNGKPAIFVQYDKGIIEQIKLMKRAIDPNNLLNQGNVIGTD